MALREARECMEALGEMLAKADVLKAESGGEVLVKIVRIGGIRDFPLTVHLARQF